VVPYQVVGHLTHIEECDWIDRTRVILEHGTERVFDPVDQEAGFPRSLDQRDAILEFGTGVREPTRAGWVGRIWRLTR
jgi:hypothetical protein